MNNSELGKILSIRYIERDKTVGHKEPPLIQVLRDGEGSGIVYEIKETYDTGNCPEDVYQFIEENCSEPFYEANYTHCLETVLINRLKADEFFSIKAEAKRMQDDLSKEIKKNSFMSQLRLVGQE